MTELGVPLDPDQHLNPEVAASYDAATSDRHGAGEVQPEVPLLAELAGGGTAVEFAVGTGRVALPLARGGTRVLGIDFSEPMLAELAKKDGAGSIDTTVGDMTETQVCSDASLVYLIFNTIGNLRTQHQQVACFRNAAEHLRPGGRFVVEVGVPKLHRLTAGESIQAYDVSPDHLGFNEYVDRVNQLFVSHHYFITGDRVRTLSGTFRYVWPSELDLMAELAGMTLEDRWADWERSQFTGESPAHVSVYRKAHPC